MQCATVGHPWLRVIHGTTCAQMRRGRNRIAGEGHFDYQQCSHARRDNCRAVAFPIAEQFKTDD